MSETHPAEPDRDVVLVVLGGGGDLTRRLLLPGLGSLLASRRHPPRVTVVGVGRSEYPEDDWRAMIAGCVPAGEPGHDDLAEVAARSRYARLDVTDAGQLSGLLEREAGADGDPEVLAYFALPAAVTSSACHALADLGRPLPEAVQLVLEKPFGTSSSSAADLDRVLAALAPADRVHRVDHFLGLPGVHQLLALRMWNPALGRVWDHESIERVDVVFDETLALEGRAGFYDATGALEDMLQSHLMLVAALAAMEPPADLRAEELHASVLEVLRTMRVRGSDPVASARRARYTAGAVAGRAVPSYVDEEGVDGARGTETFAELDLEVRAPRWSGVPFRLRSGKALPANRHEVVVTMRGAGGVPDSAPTRIRVGLEPAGLTVELVGVSPDGALAPSPETLSGEGSRDGELLPYGAILGRILDHDPLLSVPAGAAEECWRIVEPVLAAWHGGGGSGGSSRVPPPGYTAGTDPTGT